MTGFDREVDREKTRNTPGKNRETNREMKKTGQKRGKNGVKIPPKTVVLHLSQLAYFFRYFRVLFESVGVENRGFEKNLSRCESVWTGVNNYYRATYETVALPLSYSGLAHENSSVSGP